MTELDEDIEIQEKPRKSILRKIIKYFSIFILTIVGLNLLLYLLLSIPAVQNKAKDIAVNELKKMLDTEISIEKIRLSLFDHISLENIYIEDRNKDTLLFANDLNAGLDIWQLLNGELLVTGIKLDDFIIKANQQDSLSDYNYQFIIDTFASHDSIPKEDTSEGGLRITLKDIVVKNGRLKYEALWTDPTPHIFNASRINIHDFNTKIDINSIDSKAFDINLKSLSAVEQSGLHIKNLEGRLFSEGDQLWLDDLELELPNSLLALKELRYNIADNKFRILTKEVEIDPNDLQAFYLGLKHLNQRINLNTHIEGQLPLINIEQLSIDYGKERLLTLNAQIDDYTKYGESFFNLAVKEFNLSPTTLSSLIHVVDSTFVTPDILKNLGDLSLKADLNGKLSQFKLNSQLLSKAGNITLTATGQADTTFTDFNINASLKTQKFSLAQAMGKDSGLGNLALSLNLIAAQKPQQAINAKMDGFINNIEVLNNSITDSPLTAFYNAEKMGATINATLGTGKIIAKAEMSQAKVPDIKAYIKVDSLEIDRVYQNPDWKDPYLSFDLNGDIKGLDIDKMAGEATINNLCFKDSAFHFEPGPIALKITQPENENDNKNIDLISSFFNANIKGKYTFTTLANDMSNLIHAYLPNVLTPTKKAENSNNDFQFTITAENTDELSRIFKLPLEVILPIRIEGDINTNDNKINIVGEVPHIQYSDFDIKGFILDIANKDSVLYANLNSDISIDKETFHLLFNLDGYNNTLNSVLSIYANPDNTFKTNGDIETHVRFDRLDDNVLQTLLQIKESDININGLDLRLLPASIKTHEGHFDIDSVGIAVNKKPYLLIDGILSSSREDTLAVKFNHAEVADILHPFNIQNIKACVHGNILLTNTLATPELYTKDLEIADIVVFGDTLGKLWLKSEWSQRLDGIALAAALQKKHEVPIICGGIIFPQKDSLNTTINIDRLPIGWANPFLSDVFNEVSGSISSQLTVTGKLSKPITKGWFGLNNTTLGINYTNVTYTISDTIDIAPDRIGFDNLKVLDKYHNMAKVSATLTHENFRDMKYALKMDLNNLMLLNTEHRTDSLFYGKLFASGRVNVTGDDKHIDVKMNIRNNKNSKINVLIPQTSTATQYKSVVYINTPKEEDEEESRPPITAVQPLPLNLDVTLTLTPDIDLGVVINPITGDNMHIQGNGDIKFKYNLATEDMSTNGRFKVDKGQVKINLQQLKTLDFKIQENSVLDFIGDPLNTQFNITAYKTVRADLKSLDPSFADNNSSTRVPVNCVLTIKGDMDKMEIGYDIDLPEASDDILQKVRSIVSTDEQRVKQFAYLVGFGMFFSSTGNNNVTDGLLTSIASNTISGGLNSVFGSILGDSWEVGTNIESNDGTFNDMNIGVNVSKKLFNDKLRFSTNIGYKTDKVSDNPFIGDFDVEYQLSPMWTIKAYNKTNERYYEQEPMKQGIGIVYTREARSLRRLFRFWVGDGERSRNRKGQNKDTSSNVEQKEKDQKKASKE